MTDNFTKNFRSIPQVAEDFGTIRQAAENFRNIPQITERQESHTLTVREVARMFEDAGVARTERSIINWCHPNKLGVCRLDAYFDPNERKHFITPQSVELAIKEEQAKSIRTSEGSEPVRKVPKSSETRTDELRRPRNESEDVDSKVLEREIRDLKITNQAKDYYIERLEKERESFVEKLMLSSHKVGELETKLLQLDSPEQNVVTDRNIVRLGDSERTQRD